MANFSTTNPGADVLAAYQKATQLSPISKTDKKKVLSDYGINVGWAKKQTDKGISMKAADAVVAKFKKDQAAKQPKPAPTKPTTPAKPSTSQPKPTAVSASLVSQTLNKYGLPSTSKPPSYAMTDSNQLEAWAQRAVRQMLGYSNTVSATVASMIPATLKKYGLPTTSRPPTYALASPKELEAWATRARRYMLYGY